MAPLPRWKVVGLGVAALLFVTGMALTWLEEPPAEQVTLRTAPPVACTNGLEGAGAGTAPCPSANAGADPP